MLGDERLNIAGAHDEPVRASLDPLECVSRPGGPVGVDRDLPLVREDEVDPEEQLFHAEKVV